MLEVKLSKVWLTTMHDIINLYVESLMIIRDFGVQTRVKYAFGAEEVNVKLNVI